MQQITMTVNGRTVTAEIDERTLLLEFVRDVAGSTGTKNGCLEARCGCCTVHVDGQSVKSCNALALQFPGADVRTVEGLASTEGPETFADGNGGVGPLGFASTRKRLGTLQRAFDEHGALQCGFCTPGMLMCIADLLERKPDLSEDEVRTGISGNLCRCTGYQKIVDATLDVASGMRRSDAP